MYFIDQETIRKIATIPEWIDAMVMAMKMSISEDYIMPKRMHIDHGRDTFLLMPCITDEYWVTKLVSFCPDNSAIALPSIYGTIIVNDTKTGEPLAVMDGSIITAMRTAAVSAAGIKLLSQVNSHSLGIIGTGAQSIYQAKFACSVREIKEIWAFDRNPANVKRFIEAIQSEYPEIKVQGASDSSEVSLNSEIIISATNSETPVFQNLPELLSGKTFVGIGSYKPECREFPEKLFQLIDQVFVDTIHAKSESGDLITPVKNNWLREDRIYPLASLISGEIGLTSAPTRLFKTVGSAIFDLYAAKLVYENYLSKNAINQQ